MSCCPEYHLADHIQWVFRKKLKSQSKELSPYELQLYSLLTKTSVPVLKSAILWLHDTVDGFWSSWLTSPTHRVFLSTGCSPSLKTWSKKKAILCSRAFHHLTEFLLLISGLWSSLCVVSTYSMTLFGILKFGLFVFFFLPWEAFLGKEEPSCTVLGDFQLAVTLVSSVVVLLGQPAALCHVGTAKCSFIRLWSESFARRLVQSGFSIHAGQADSLLQLWCQI